MDGKSSKSRSDEQLAEILRENGHWVVNDQGGRVLCFAPSLIVAIDRAAAFASSGTKVSRLARLPYDNIIVLPDQLCRLRKMAGEVTH
jgi:hypothetical protein